MSIASTVLYIIAVILFIIAIFLFIRGFRTDASVNWTYAGLVFLVLAIIFVVWGYALGRVQLSQSKFLYERVLGKEAPETFNEGDILNELIKKGIVV